MTEESLPKEPPKRKLCRCGHDRDHHMVSAEGEYTFSGYLRLFFGISARPIRVNYRCRRCDKTFDTTTNPKVLDARVGF
ncbi:MAG TPA: hypothetical protein PK156_32045 [Polyangium sp.]|nr:hypothetical protein [Polyangium sp.]